MLSNKYKIIIISTTIVVLIVAICAWAYYSNEQGQTLQNVEKSNIAKAEIINTLNNNVGGYETQDGFDIAYLETEQIFTITITKNPFEKYKAAAEYWMTQKGLDPQDTAFICFTTADVTATEEQLNRCGTANIQ